MATRNITTKIALEGDAEYKKALQDINGALKTAKSELAAVSSEYRNNANSIEALTANQTALQKQYDLQIQKVNQLKAAFENADKAAKQNGEESEALAKKAESYQRALNYANVQLNSMDDALQANAKYLDEAKASTDGCATSIDKYGKKTKEAADSTDDAKDSAGRLKDIFAGGLAADIVSNALGAVVNQLKEFIGNAIEASDYIGTLADKTGISTDRLQELQYAGISLDTELSTITDSLKKLINNMSAASNGTGSAYEAFEKLGVSVTDETGALRDSNVVFYEVVDALAAMTNGTERDAAAQDILGKSATDLNPLIKAGSEELAKLSKEAHTVGAVMDTETIAVLDSLDETVQKVKLSLQSMLADGVAALLGALPTAAESADALNEQLTKTSNISDAVKRYKELTAIIADQSTKVGVLESAHAELTELKQTLIEMSGGVITAFDLENGTFVQQLEQLTQLNDAQRESVRLEAERAVFAATGADANEEAARATEEYADLQQRLTEEVKQLEEANQHLSEHDYFVSVGSDVTWQQVADQALSNIDKLRDKLSSSSDSMQSVSDTSIALEENLRILAALGLTADEAFTKFGVTEEEFNRITQQQAEIVQETASGYPQLVTAVDITTDAVAKLKQAYDDAKAASIYSLDSQIGKWDLLKTDAVTSVTDIMTALESQLTYLEDYSDNLTKLMQVDIPGVDTSELIQSLSDGSAESAAILAGLSTASDEEIAEIVKSFDGINEAKDNLAGIMADIQTDYQKKLDELVSITETMAKDLDRTETAKTSGEQTMDGYIAGIDARSAAVELEMRRVAKLAQDAWKFEFDINSPSKVMAKFGEYAIDGNIEGVERAVPKLDITYQQAAATAMGSYSMAMLTGAPRESMTAADAQMLGGSIASRITDAVQPGAGQEVNVVISFSGNSDRLLAAKVEKGSRLRGGSLVKGGAS